MPKSKDEIVSEIQRNLDEFQEKFNPNSRGYLLTTSTSPSTILFTRVTHRQD